MQQEINNYALMSAIKSGNIEKVGLAIDVGANPTDILKYDGKELSITQIALEMMCDWTGRRPPKAIDAIMLILDKSDTKLDLHQEGRLNSRHYPQGIKREQYITMLRHSATTLTVSDIFSFAQSLTKASWHSAMNLTNALSELKGHLLVAYGELGRLSSSLIDLTYANDIGDYDAFAEAKVIYQSFADESLIAFDLAGLLLTVKSTTAKSLEDPKTKEKWRHELDQACAIVKKNLKSYSEKNITSLVGRLAALSIGDFNKDVCKILSIHFPSLLDATNKKRSAIKKAEQYALDNFHATDGSSDMIHIHEHHLGIKQYLESAAATPAPASATTLSGAGEGAGAGGAPTSSLTFAKTDEGAMFLTIDTDFSL